MSQNIVYQRVQTGTHVHFTGNWPHERDLGESRPSLRWDKEHPLLEGQILLAKCYFHQPKDLFYFFDPKDKKKVSAVQESEDSEGSTEMRRNINCFFFIMGCHGFEKSLIRPTRRSLREKFCEEIDSDADE